MKHTLKALMLCMVASYHLYGQGVIVPHYSIVNTPGATLTQVIDTMLANANPADTGEGGTFDQITTFQQLWQQDKILAYKLRLNIC